MSSRVRQLLEQVQQLSEEELHELQIAVAERRWTDDAWDRQMRDDAASGKLDALIREAQNEARTGNTRPLP